MIFTILGIFSGFFLIFLFKFLFKNDKKILKIKKGCRGARVDATWHARPRGSATRTRAARLRGAVYYLFIIYIYINGSLSFPIWEGSYL